MDKWWHEWRLSVWFALCEVARGLSFVLQPDVRQPIMQLVLRIVPAVGIVTILTVLKSRLPIPGIENLYYWAFLLYVILGYLVLSLFVSIVRLHAGQRRGVSDKATGAIAHLKQVTFPYSIYEGHHDVASLAAIFAKLGPALATGMDSATLERRLAKDWDGGQAISKHKGQIVADLQGEGLIEAQHLKERRRGSSGTVFVVIGEEYHEVIADKYFLTQFGAEVLASIRRSSTSDMEAPPP